MADNGNIVRRVCEHQIRRLLAYESANRLRILRIAADQLVFDKLSNIDHLRYANIRRHGNFIIGFGHFVCRGFPCMIER